MDIKLQNWIEDINTEIKECSLPMIKRVLLDIKDKTIKRVEEQGYAYDLKGYKITKE